MTLTQTARSDLLFTAENVKSICAVIQTQTAKSDLRGVGMYSKEYL